MQDSSAVITAAFASQTVKYVTVAATTGFVFDYFVTLDLEVKHIWKSPLGIGEILFYISRYSPFIDLSVALYYVTGTLLADQTCKNLYSVTLWVSAAGIGAAEGIMALRTWALWENSRPLLYYLVFFYLAISVLGITCLTLFVRSLRFGPPPLPTIGCHQVAGNPIILVPYAILILFETITTILASWAGIKRFRQSSSPLVKILYRDGAFYFIGIFITSVANITLLFTGAQDYLNLLTTFQRVMHGILSTRSILHMRSMRGQLQGNGLETSMEVSHLRFVPESRGIMHQVSVFPPIRPLNIDIERIGW